MFLVGSAVGLHRLVSDGTERDIVLTRQAAYRQWLAKDLQLPHLLPDAAVHPYLGFRRTLRLTELPFAIHLIGLDSAWLCGDDHDAGKLRVTEDQVMRLSTTTEGNGLDGFRLALMHHPLEDLLDGAHCRRLLAERVDLLLRGHLHEPEPSTWADPERKLRQLVAGCLYEGHSADQYPNACHVIDVTLDTAGRPQRYTLRFRGWSVRGHWFDDNSLYPETTDGRLTWWVSAKHALPSMHPRVRDVFVGRQEELATLTEALLPRDGGAQPIAICSVQGMPGVGKSYLVDRFYHEHASDFPGGYFRLTLNPHERLTTDVLLARLLDQLELTRSSNPAAQISDRLRTPRALLHIENVDSQTVAETTAQLVAGLPGCSIAVSGRFQRLGVTAGWRQLRIAPFDAHTALQQLAQELGTTTVPEHVRLVRTLGYLPLAVHLAAGHLRAGRSVAGFLTLLRQRGLNIAPEDPADPGMASDRTRAILQTAFLLSLDLLRSYLSTDADRLLEGFSCFGHAPSAGVGNSLGAAILGLSEAEFEELVVDAYKLSLLEQAPGSDLSYPFWRLHPLLAELLRSSSDEAAVRSRMTAWFVERLPALAPGDEEKQGQRWQEVQREHAALLEWLPLVPDDEVVQIKRTGSQYAQSNGPFQSWVTFCERALALPLMDEARSNFLWTLSQVARHAGMVETSLRAARDKAELDRRRGADREVALARGTIADILQAQGHLDEALRIRQQEELPVYERLDDVGQLAITQGKIADILQARGQLDEALRILQQKVLPCPRTLG